MRSRSHVVGVANNNMAELSNRQSRRLRGDIAKRMVETELQRIFSDGATTIGEDNINPIDSADHEADISSNDSDHEADIDPDYMDHEAGIDSNDSDYDEADINSDHDSDDIDLTDSDYMDHEADINSNDSDYDEVDINSDHDSDDIDLTDSDHMSHENDEIETSTSASFTSEADSNCNENEDTEITRTALFTGSSISCEELSVALLSIFHKHGTTYSCITDILKLFIQALPPPTSVPASHHLLLHKFVNYDSNTIRHYCCGYCTRPLLPGTTCSSSECQSTGVSEASFIEVYIDKQIRRLYSGMLFFV